METCATYHSITVKKQKHLCEINRKITLHNFVLVHSHHVLQTDIYEGVRKGYLNHPRSSVSYNKTCLNLCRL